MHRLLPLVAVALTIVTLAAAGTAAAQLPQSNDATVAPKHELTLRPIRTDSPRDTLESFLRISGELAETILRYRSNKSPELMQRIALLSEQVLALIDLSEVPAATRRERGEETGMALLDIFGRIAPPALDDVPDVDAIADRKETVLWRVPNTPIRIGAIEDGPRQGEFLFVAQTVRAAPRFFRGIQELPLTPRIPFNSWTDMSRQITGPLIPSWLVQAMPKSLLATWMDTPAWKVLLMTLVNCLAILLAVLLSYSLQRLKPKNRRNRIFVQMITPLALLVAVTVLIPNISREMNLSGQAAQVDGFIRTVASYAVCAWLFWLSVRSVSEAVISSPWTSDESYDANLLRLISGILGIIGFILILAYGGQQLGLPVMSLVAGLGIGGLAVALAIRPTLENLIGGFTLYIDRPVRVGDFCTFGSQNGTIESIGIRSTQIRALDRTLISVPNAQFADMQLINWAHCDQMLINETIGIRYETTADQLRFVLARIREMLHGHPRIDPHTVRVRFAGYGDSSLNIDLRIYAKTREWNDFFAIREDIFLRIYDIVTDAGTGFAFPSRTVYLGRDPGLEEHARNAAEEQVQSWRQSGRLPFPRLPEKRQESLEGTLDYPPRGSFEADSEEVETSVTPERLSTEQIDRNRDDSSKKAPT